MKRIVLSFNHPVILLLALCSFVSNPLHAAPRIECDAPKHDFGTVIGQEQIVHEFILRNTGDEPLEIVKIKNCCGVETKVVPMTIPPGSNAVCTSVFTTKNRYGAQDKQILLVTNDKQHLYYDLRMTGTLLKPVEFEPRLIRLGDILPDTVVSETITVTNLLEDAVVLESVSTTVKGLEAEVVSDDCRAGTAEGLPAASKGAAGGDGAAERSSTVSALQNDVPVRSWTVRVKSTGPLAVGRINGQVQLNFSSGTVNVPIVGEVKPIIQATPEKTQLSAGSAKEAERLVMLRSGDGRAFEVLSATLESADGKVETKKLADGKWQINLTAQPSTIKPDAAIAIKTVIESQDIITILVRIR